MNSSCWTQGKVFDFSSEVLYLRGSDRFGSLWWSLLFYQKCGPFLVLLCFDVNFVNQVGGCAHVAIRSGGDAWGMAGLHQMADAVFSITIVVVEMCIFGKYKTVPWGRQWTEVRNLLSNCQIICFPYNSAEPSFLKLIGFFVPGYLGQRHAQWNKSN